VREREPTPIVFLHRAETLNRVKLEYFAKLSTEVILESLATGQDGSLKTRPDGLLLDGHHRLAVLLGRGLDIHSLPRTIIEKEV